MDLRKALVLGLVSMAATAAYADNGFQDAAIGNNDYIIGGTEVASNDPVAATTVLITDGNYICSGSIIADDMVVTAAHCVAAPADTLRVVFSRSMDGVSKADVRGITGYVANPKWAGDAAKGADQGDIAVMHLSGALPAGYHPADLLTAPDSKALKKGDTTLLAGFGITDAATHDGAGTLREVEVNILKKLGKTEVVLDQTVNKGACHGDSGGPAFAQVGGKLFLWGVTNRGYPDNAPDDCVHYAVYTRIQAYADWIASTEAQLRSNSGSPSPAPADTVAAATAAPAAPAKSHRKHH